MTETHAYVHVFLGNTFSAIVEKNCNKFNFKRLNIVQLNLDLCVCLICYINNYSYNNAVNYHFHYGKHLRYF